MANHLSAKELEKELEKELKNLYFLLVSFCFKVDIKKIVDAHMQRENAEKATKDLDFIFEEIRAEDKEQVQQIEEIMTDAAKLSLPELKTLNHSLENLTVDVRKELVMHSKNRLDVLTDLSVIRAFLNNSVVQKQMNQLMQLAQAIADASCQEAESVIGGSTAKQEFMKNMSEFLIEQRTGIETTLNHYQHFHAYAESSSPSPSFRQNNQEALPELHKLITLFSLYGQLKIQHPTYIPSPVVPVFSGLESLLQSSRIENEIQLRL